MFMLLKRIVLLVTLMVCVQTPALAEEAKRIVFLGLSGAGKTTLVNHFYTTISMLNEAEGAVQAHFVTPIVDTNRQGADVFYPSPGQLCRRLLVDKPENPRVYRSIPGFDTDTADVRDSHTTAIVGYEIEDDTGMRYELIDTPGLFDSRGFDMDKIIKEIFVEFLTMEPIDAIVVVVDGDAVRDDAKTLDMLKMLLSLVPSPDIADKVFFVLNKNNTAINRDFCKKTLTNILKDLGIETTLQLFGISPSTLVKIHKNMTLTQKEEKDYVRNEQAANVILGKIQDLQTPIQTGKLKEINDFVVAFNEQFNRRVLASAGLKKLQPEYEKFKGTLNTNNEYISKLTPFQCVERLRQDKDIEETRNQWQHDKITLKINLFHKGQMCDHIGDVMHTFDDNRLGQGKYYQHGLTHLFQKFNFKKVQGSAYNEYTCTCGKPFEPRFVRVDLVEQKSTEEKVTYKNYGDIHAYQQEVKSIVSLVDQLKHKGQVTEKELQKLSEKWAALQNDVTDSARVMQQLWRQVSEQEFCQYQEFLEKVQLEYNLQKAYRSKQKDIKKDIEAILNSKP